jgi:hypothetical protein
MQWTAWQVLSRPTQAPERKPPNPKPPGCCWSGGSPKIVLAWLKDRPSPQAWWSMHQIIRGTGLSAKQCSWAVIFLNRHAMIQRERGVQNSRYLRYRATLGGK